MKGERELGRGSRVHNIVSVQNQGNTSCLLSVWGLCPSRTKPMYGKSTGFGFAERRPQNYPTQVATSGLNLVTDCVSPVRYFANNLLIHLIQNELVGQVLVKILENGCRCIYSPFQKLFTLLSSSEQIVSYSSKRKVKSRVNFLFVLNRFIINYINLTLQCRLQISEFYP